MTYTLRYIAGLLLLSFSLLAHANMASPDSAGTQAGSGHFSHDIDILSEVIDIQVFETLSAAEYTIDYEVYSDKSREQVPLVFDVDDIKGEFQISVDNEPVQSLPVKDIQGMRHVYKEIRTPRISSDINDYNGKVSSNELALEFEDSSQFFLIDLTEGTHNIRVNYTAIADENRLDWTKRYRYHYALAPAKLWKTFNNLTIKIRIAGDSNALDWTTNLGEPQSRKPQSAGLGFENEWHFSDIPQEAIVIELQQRPSVMAQILISLNSWIVFIGSMGLFGFIHCWLIKNRLTTSRTLIKPSEAQSKDTTNYSQSIIWVGILTVPVISLLLTVLRFDFIDWLIGMHASHYHGYVIFILIFGYPFVLLGYLIFVKFMFIKWIQRRV